MTRNVALIVLAFAFATGCSSNSKAVTTTSSSAIITAPTTAAPATTLPLTVPTTVAPLPTSQSATTLPLATAAPQPIETQLQHLLDRYDAAAADILTDPRVASDPASPKVAAFLALFPQGSKFAEGTVTYWAEEGAKGRFYRPGPGGALFTSKLRKVVASSDTEVSFTVCATESMEIVDQAGTIQQANGGLSGGEIVAVKVNGEWLLRDLTEKPAGDCPKPGSTG